LKNTTVDNRLHYEVQASVSMPPRATNTHRQILDFVAALILIRRPCSRHMSRLNVINASSSINVLQRDCNNSRHSGYF